MRARCFQTVQAGGQALRLAWRSSNCFAATQVTLMGPPPKGERMSMTERRQQSPRRSTANLRARCFPGGGGKGQKRKAREPTPDSEPEFDEGERRPLGCGGKPGHGRVLATRGRRDRSPHHKLPAFQVRTRMLGAAVPTLRARSPVSPRSGADAH